MIRPAPSLNSRFFYHLSQTSDFQEALRRSANKSSQAGVYLGRLKEIEFLFPTLDEQRRIAAILDKAAAIRRKRQESLRLTDEFLRSVFLEMFGDPVTNPKKWREICFGHLAGDTFRSGLSPSHRGRVLTLSSITSGQFTSRHTKAALFDRSPSSSQLLSRKTFLVCRGNGNRTLVGVGVFPNCDSEDVCFPDTMIGVNPNRELVTQAYLEHIWRSSSVRRQLESMARTTNGTYKINQGSLEKVTFPLPPLPEQERLALISDQTRSLRDRSLIQLTKIDMLFSSLQQRAFGGEL